MSFRKQSTDGSWTNLTTLTPEGGGETFTYKVEKAKFDSAGVYRCCITGQESCADTKVTIAGEYSTSKLNPCTVYSLNVKSPLGHHAGLGQYNSLGRYCGPHTASSVFFLISFPAQSNMNVLTFKLSYAASIIFNLCAWCKSTLILFVSQ